MTEEKQKSLNNILNVLSSINSNLISKNIVISKLEQKEEDQKAANFYNKGIKKISDNKSTSKKDDKTQNSILNFLELFFATLLVSLPMLIKSFKSAKDSIMSFPEKCKIIFNKSIDNLFNLTKDYVITPLSDLFNLKIPAMIDMMSMMIGDFIKSIIFTPASIINQIQVFIEQTKLNMASSLLDMIVEYGISAFLPLQAVETALAERKQQSLKRIQELNEEQSQREEELAAIKSTSYKEIYDDSLEQKSSTAAAAPAPAAPSSSPQTQQQSTSTPYEVKDEKRVEVDAENILETTDSSDLLNYATKADAGVNVDKINPELKKRVAAVSKAIKEKTGQKLIITSGYRSNEKQKKLWEAKVREYGGDTNLPYPYGLSQEVISQLRWKVAPPVPIGKGSLHLSGLAMDLNSHQLNPFAGDRTNSTGWLEKFGLIRPIPKENWHVQLDGSPPTPDNPEKPGSPVQVANEDPSKALDLSSRKSETVNTGNLINKKSMDSKIEKPEVEDITIIKSNDSAKGSNRPANQTSTNNSSKNNSRELYRMNLSAA